MILDAYCQLSDSQALTATAVSTNTFDANTLQADPDPDWGAGEPMCAVINVEVAADFTSGNETYSFGIVEDDAADLGTNTNIVDVTIAAAKLTAGKIIVIPIPAGLWTKRYLGMEYTLGGSTPTITVSAYLQPLNMVQQDKSYADNITITTS